MELTGLLYGQQLLKLVGFPVTEVLGPEASEDAIKVYAPYVGAATAPGFGNIDLANISLWKMKRPVDANEFKREWAKKYEK